MRVTRRKQLIAAAVAVAVAGVATVIATRGDGADQAETALTAPSSTSAAKRSSSSTTKAAKQTTTTAPAGKATSPGGADGTPDAPAAEPPPAPTPKGDAPRSGAGPYKVATAKAATINVVLGAPDGVGDEPPKLDARPAFAGDQQATPPLPRAEQPVQGRFATDEGYRFDNPQPFGDPLTFLVVRTSGDWLQVQLPVRPNGTMGWIKKSEVEMSEVGSHVEVNVAERKLRIFDGTSLIEEAPVAVGVDATQTPTGRHFMTDKLAEPGGAQRHPWSLGISAYSEQLDTFDGGAPQIAMHGWRDSSVFGQARSNGCIRVPSGVIDRLAALPLGTPIDVYAN